MLSRLLHPKITAAMIFLLFSIILMSYNFKGSSYTHWGCTRKSLGKFISKQFHQLGSGGVVVRAFSLYWSGIKFESLSTHHRWILSKSFISRLVVIVVSTKKVAFGGKMTNKKSNGGDWLLWPWASYFEYHSFESTITRSFGCKHGTIACYGELVRKGTGFEKHTCLFGVHPGVSGKLKL